MKKIQEVRGEVRQLLSDTLTMAQAMQRDGEKADLIAYELGKAAALRSVLARFQEIA